ncbi:site-specific integrase [Pseudomonas sp. ACN5]|uniref:site-specific integrase n=1 Tax=Pseudomonas sp. ACN5 TaxID=1920427 RepID=UPI0011447343|nr:site-specific integrase [Pseudomonas sp. ACN5]PBJ09760.1 hypothetical protein BSF40_10170 [Pseudomonas sp. ACN5]
MSKKHPLPNLTFPTVIFGRYEAHWDFKPLLYVGGARLQLRVAKIMIEDSKLGTPITQRIEIIEKLHDEVEARIVAGGSRATAKGNVDIIRRFVAWIDDKNKELTTESIASCFIQWTDHLQHKVKVEKTISFNSAFGQATQLASLIDEALELKYGIMKQSGLRRKGRKSTGKASDKQNLSHTFKFGNMLIDIAGQLPADKIWGELPVKIQLRAGSTLTEWSGLRDPLTLKQNIQPRPEREKSKSEARELHIAEKTWRTRYPLINLRIETELLIFISQTGMNLTQAYKLERGKFSYQTHHDGYQVRRVYKNRRQGEVEFEIFSEYREVLDRYLRWLDAVFPNQDGLLFPVSSPRERNPLLAPNFYAVRTRCKNVGVKFIGPRLLRNTRVNWLLRRTNDPQLIAEMSQHTQEVLLNIYEIPNHQKAAIEISRFLSLQDLDSPAPGPGSCVNADPKAISGTPEQAPQPDCVNPAGCLFCFYHRDIDSFEHVWSLASYRHYKTHELVIYKDTKMDAELHPAKLVVKRITEKLEYISDQSEKHRKWVKEAKDRIYEEDFHPYWDGFISLAEEFT